MPAGAWLLSCMKAVSVVADAYSSAAPPVTRTAAGFTVAVPQLLER